MELRVEVASDRKSVKIFGAIELAQTQPLIALKMAEWIGRFIPEAITVYLSQTQEERGRVIRGDTGLELAWEIARAYQKRRE